MLQHKKIETPYFYRKKLKDSESIFVGEISKKSPFDITIVPTITYDGIAATILSIIQIIIAVKSICKDKNNDKSKAEKERRRTILKTEFERKQVRRYDGVIEEESIKLTYSKIEMDEVDIEDKDYEKYFGKKPHD